MRKLLFFCRVAFLCNVCFLLAWLIQYLPVSPHGHIASTIVVLGTGLAVILNIAVNFFVVISLLQKKMDWSVFPRWLIIVNFLFLLLQIIILLFN
ncbi:hypothetical protein [Pseudobacter ginsenosidimutans]|uniref:Uncharacterized protein n=1 Tax=Pseudobacter ginsenosidimutans TaxID=661488 RepID=A0A4Q7N3E5_9BACT|nr:hypothetical protein [Pseudobacter ginsenosidimutans]RZS75295.1 hypothetical protein EV199_1158 [Pseudobacter ginsenosidimutans]